jgi:predicted component of type VI protein secretion system
MGVKSSFFEWMLLWLSKKDKSKTLRIIGSNSLKHPSGDIDFEKATKNEVVLALNEMSLCGADSPLPDNLLRGIRTENDNSIVLAEFLNALQHYLAMFRFNAILGRSDFFMQVAGDLKWQNRFILYNERFSPEALRCFFAKKFPNAEISVYCFEPLRIENPSPVFLGKTILNGTNILGKSCISLTNAMRICIYGVSLEQSTELKKNKGFFNMKFPFKVKISFSTKVGGEICKLGNQKLSENFWLGSKNFEEFKWEKWV